MENLNFDLENPGKVVENAYEQVWEPCKNYLFVSKFFKWMHKNGLNDGQAKSCDVNISIPRQNSFILYLIRLYSDDLRQISTRPSRTFFASWITSLHKIRYWIFSKLSK